MTSMQVSFTSATVEIGWKIPAVLKMKVVGFGHFKVWFWCDSVIFTFHAGSKFRTVGLWFSGSRISANASNSCRKLRQPPDLRVWRYFPCLSSNQSVMCKFLPINHGFNPIIRKTGKSLTTKNRDPDVSHVNAQLATALFRHLRRFWTKKTPFCAQNSIQRTLCTWFRWWYYCFAFQNLSVWLGGLFVPEAYITATRQYVAQAYNHSLEELTLRVKVTDGNTAAALDNKTFAVNGMVSSWTLCWPARRLPVDCLLGRMTRRVNVTWFSGFLPNRFRFQALVCHEVPERLGRFVWYKWGKKLDAVRIRSENHVRIGFRCEPDVCRLEFSKVRMLVSEP